LAGASAQAAEPGYVDPLECRPCHQQIYDAYSKTGMGRSFRKPLQLPPLQEFFHKPSQRFYSLVERSGSLHLRRQQAGGTNVLEKRIDYLIGSGHHSITPVHRNEQGRLVELPLSWYAERGGYWAMSPGYDRPDHSDFRRELSDGCLFCHNGYPSAANGGLAMGIDCQRCHGPGEQHARRRGKIVNPAALSPDRHAEVCMQCHLETAGRNIPEAIRRFDRTPFSYRPGEALSNYMLYFRFADPDVSDTITVNSSANRLRESQCFLRSNGRLRCTTCHDPHGVSAINVADVCRTCHISAHAREKAGCDGCHMPKRRTQDAVHVVMTDHRIRREPLAEDALRPKTEQHDRRTGRIGLLHPEGRGQGTRLYLAVAQARSSANPSEAAAELAGAIGMAKPREADPYIALAEAYGRAGEIRKAIAAWTEAFSLEPDKPPAATRLAELLAAAGQHRKAIVMLEHRLPHQPSDAPLLNALAVLYGHEGRFADALRLLGTAIRAAPDDPVSWLNTGVCLEASGDKNGAEAAYRQAVQLQPDLMRAQEFLKRVSKH
jgi:Tfp pilus assembly protein PilF